MNKKFKRFLGILLSVVMILGSMPLTIFAAGGATLTIYTDVSANGIDIDDDVSFDYIVAIGGLLYDGTAKGDDGKTYDIVNGKLTVPYNVKAVISGIPDGIDYNVQRLAYDNPKYALVAESGHITGEIASREYYKIVNGERTQIDAETFNRETDNGANLSRHYFLGTDGAEYDSAISKKYYTYEENKTLGVANGTYSAVEHEYTFAPVTAYDYTVSITDIGHDEITSKKVGFVTTYTIGNAWSTVSTDYSSDISYHNSSKPTTSTQTSASGARNTLLSHIQTKQNEGMKTVLDMVAEDSGKTAVVDKGIVTPSLDDLSNQSTTMHIFTEVTEQTVSYETVSVEVDKVAAFDVTLEKAPTGTVSVDFMLDGTVPEGFDGAIFELRNAAGVLLTEGVDYELEVKPVSIDLKVAEIGFTRYVFSDLAAGVYTLQQIEGKPSYAVDTTRYTFTVERDGSISGEHVAAANSTLGDPSSVIYNMTKSYNLLVSKIELHFFANASFTLSFTTLDQNKEPVENAQYFMVERDEVISLISTVAKSGVTSVTNTDWGALLSSLTSGEGFTLDIETIVKLLVEVASNGNLDNVTLPAILMKKSGADGVTTFDNASNILNALDILSSLGDVKLSDLANLIKTLVGDNLSADLSKYLDMLAGFDMTISVHAGVPTGAYLFFETSAPTGYKRSSSLFTIDVASDGTAEVYSGVLLPLIADYIDGRLGYDIYNILVSEEEFQNASQQIKQMFGTFENYKNTVIDGILNFVDSTLGDRVNLGVLENIKNSITGYYDQYDDLSAAIGSALRDFNKSLVDTFDGEWVLTNERIFVDVIITVADCQNVDLENAVVTVTNVDDAEDKYTALNENGNAYLHYSTYEITVSGLDDKYVLFTDTDEEGNALYTNPVTITIGSEDAQNVSFYYHKASDWQHMDDPTCTTDGFEMLGCELCDVIFEEKILPATGHEYSAPETVEPTCTSGGYTFEICAKCGDVRITEETEAIGHDYEATVTEPTDTTAGYTTHICKNCGDTYVDSFTDPTGHELKEVDRKDATCTEAGYIKYECVNGDDYTEIIELPELGHDKVNDPAVSPTCTEKGKTAGVHCDRCGKIFEEQKEIAAKGHSYKITTQAPTCTEEGIITKVCADCDDTVTITEPARGHNYKYTYVAPTCEEPGKIISECLRCDHTEENVDPAHPEALGHDYKVRTVSATCEHDGVTIKTCSRCNNKVEIERVPKLDHHLVIDPAIEPTCTESGWTEGSHCDICNKIQDGVGEYQTEIPALGHIAVVDAHVDATCTEDGLTAGSHCEREGCGEVLVEQIVIPKLGHVEGNWKIVTLPSADSDGLMTKTCERCGEVIDEQTIPHAKLPTIGGECSCEHCWHGEGNFTCICRYPLKLQKIVFKLYRIIYKVFGIFGTLPHMCSVFGVV